MKQKIKTFFINFGKIAVALLKFAGQEIIKFFISIPRFFANFITGIIDNRRKIYVHLICIAYVSFFAILETSIFTVFKPFGATPDLLIMAILAIAFSKGPILGGVYGIYAGLLIINIGNVPNLFLPLIYCLVAYFAGLVKEEFLKDSFATRFLAVCSTSLIRTIITTFETAFIVKNFDISNIIPKVLFPEFLATLFMAFIPNLLIYYSLKWSNKTQSDKYKQKILNTIKPKED